MNVSMRDAFLDEIYEIARIDRNVMLLSNDFGAPSLDKFRSYLAAQFVHIGIAEQNMVNVAVGLAMAGKKVYMYSIAPFLPFRCYEQIRIHLGFKSYSVTGVIVGAGYSYDLSGPSHQALEDIAVMNALPGITILNASDSIMAKAFAQMTYRSSGPNYVRFDREAFQSVYHGKEHDFSDGLAILKPGNDVSIVATGFMVHQALKVSDKLASHSVDAGVIDLYRIKPLNKELLISSFAKKGAVITLEESFVDSGIGLILSAFIADSGYTVRLKRFGIPNRYLSPGGGRQCLHRLCGLDVDSVTRATLQWLEKRG